jgi:hypothetical protein
MSGSAFAEHFALQRDDPANAECGLKSRQRTSGNTLTAH